MKKSVKCFDSSCCLYAYIVFEITPEIQEKLNSYYNDNRQNYILRFDGKKHAINFVISFKM